MFFLDLEGLEKTTEELYLARNKKLKPFLEHWLQKTNDGFYIGKIIGIQKKLLLQIKQS